jgi:lysozyme
VALQNKRGMAAIVGAAAAAALYLLTPPMEGRVLKTYKDVGGVLTYCDGATENAIWGKTYTPAECNAQLDRDLARHAEGMMACTRPPVPLTDGQKVAYTDFAYNVGVDAYCGSTVARKASAGDLRGSCDALLMWNRAGGRVWPGLTRRRAAERDICLRGVL